MLKYLEDMYCYLQLTLKCNNTKMDKGKDRNVIKQVL